MSEIASASTSQASSASQAQTSTTDASVDQSAANNQQNKSADDGLEEIKVGSVSAKVSKEIAQVIKNLERGLQTKAQEAANTKKLLSLAQENPKEFYKTTGKDPYAFAESLLAEKYEEMSLTPEQKDAREKDARLKAFEEKENNSKREVLEALKEFGPLSKDLENKSREELIQLYRQQKDTYQREWSSLDQEIGGAFKESGLAPDKHLLAKVAFEMSSALKRGKSLTAKDAVAKVKGEYFSGAKSTFANMDVDRIHEVFGDEFLEKLRKYDLNRITEKSASKFGQQNQFGQTKVSSQESGKKYYNETEYRKAMGIR